MLKNLNKTKLHQTADFFGVDYEESDTKEVLVKKLEDDGVTYESYLKFEEEITGKKEEATVKESVEPNQMTAEAQFDKVVLRLCHPNPVFETHGFRFTKDNPFVAMPSGEAQIILDTYLDGKFKIASPDQVKEFYA